MDEKSEPYVTIRLFTIFVSVFLASFILIRTRRRQPQNQLPLPPSIPSLPIIGSYLFMRCGGIFHRFYAKTAKRLGPVFSCRLGSQPVLVLNDRQSIQEALIRKSAHFSDRSLSYTAKHYYNQKSKGILYRPYTDDFHRYHQQILSVLQEFGLGQIRMEQRILREVEDLILHIDSMSGQEFDPGNILSLCTLNIIASILFAKRLEQTDSGLRKLRDNISDHIHAPTFFLTFCPLLRFVPYFRKLIPKVLVRMQDMLQFIEDGIQSSLGMQSEVPSFVASYVEREGGIDECDGVDLRRLCLDLLEAGSDTTATTINWSLVFMANYPAIQKIIHDELDTQIPHDRLPDSVDTDKVPYTEATILEVLRIRPVVPLALAHKVTEDTTVAGYFVPKGTVVSPNLHAVHMDEAVWGDPEVFRPDRFLDESGSRIIRRNRIIPFSLGPRSCLGERIARQELFLLFTSLLQRFQILPSENQTKVECMETPAVVVAPSPFKVRMIPRREILSPK